MFPLSSLGICQQSQYLLVKYDEEMYTSAHACVLYDEDFSNKFSITVDERKS